MFFFTTLPRRQRARGRRPPPPGPAARSLSCSGRGRDFCPGPRPSFPLFVYPSATQKNHKKSSSWGEEVGGKGRSTNPTRLTAGASAAAGRPAGGGGARAGRRAIAARRVLGSLLRAPLGKTSAPHPRSIGPSTPLSHTTRLPTRREQTHAAAPPPRHHHHPPPHPCRGCTPPPPPPPGAEGKNKGVPPRESDASFPRPRADLGAVRPRPPSSTARRLGRVSVRVLGEGREAAATLLWCCPPPLCLSLSLCLSV